MKENSDIIIIGDKTQKENDPSDFETAISATGFGKFNLIYILLAILSVMANQYETNTISYILPAAECDLMLSLQDKGVLNSMSFVGMTFGGFIWGYLSDALGRKKMLVAGYILNGFFMLLSGFSQSLIMMAFAKFMSGFIVCGPIAILATTLSEFHCAKYRTFAVMLMGLMYSTCNVIIPLTSWSILPLPIDASLSDTFVFHSWNVLFVICSLPSFLSAIGHFLAPESPKFLMTVGKNEEALKLFCKIYTINTGNDPDSFPIKTLVDELQLQKDKANNHGDGCVTANRSKILALQEGFKQMRPLCFPPLLQKLILVCVIQFGLLGGLNTLRMWLPQIFQAINDYEASNLPESALCNMLSYSQSKLNATNEDCFVNFDNDSVYINNMIVGITSIIGYILIGLTVNVVGRKPLMFVLGILSGISGLVLYIANTATILLIIASIIYTFSAICLNVMTAVVVDLFPTTFRTLTVSTFMMAGRFGTISGNLIFPALLSISCFPPFLTIGGVTLFCTLLTLILPNTDMKALE